MKGYLYIQYVSITEVGVVFGVMVSYLPTRHAENERHSDDQKKLESPTIFRYAPYKIVQPNWNFSQDDGQR